MTLRRWLVNTRQHIGKKGLITGGKASASEFYKGAALRVFNRIPHFARDNVLDRDWEVLVVLDACRYDAFCEVSYEYDWLPNSPGHIRSMGSMSKEWMEQSFTPGYSDEMQNIAHVTWNVYSDGTLDADNWASLDEVWRDNWDEDRGLLPPQTVTEHAVRRWDVDQPERMLVHYMQPHTPHRRLTENGVVEPLKREDQTRRTVWKLLRRGDMTREEAWEAYLWNLRWVLDEVAVLVDALDATDVVVTADHGDCFGEWGLYGHPGGVPVPELIKVPWAEVETTKVPPRDGPSPEMNETKGESGTAEERLKQLGYLD